MKKPKPYYYQANHRTCALCGRVGSRVFMRDDKGRTICRNVPACVQRACDEVFLDKPDPYGPYGKWVLLGHTIEEVKFYDRSGVEPGQMMEVALAFREEAKILAAQTLTPRIRLFDKDMREITS